MCHKRNNKFNSNTEFSECFANSLTYLSNFLLGRLGSDLNTIQFIKQLFSRMLRHFKYITKKVFIECERFQKSSSNPEARHI